MANISDFMTGLLRRAGVVGAAAGVMLTGLAGAANPAQALTLMAAAPGSGDFLTCFAVDVSGSNLVTSNGEPPSDPGPVFVRQQVVQFYDQVLADLGDAPGQEVAVVTFGTVIGTELGPVSLSDSAARSRLEAALPAALRPSQAEAAWTDWVAGVDGCNRMFHKSRASQGMAAVLTDGFPESPAGGPTRQLAAISPVAARLWAKGIAIQPVLYGAGADRPGSARQAMSRLAVIGHGQLVLAATPLGMLRSALRLASLATGLPLGGTEIPVDGNSNVPLDLPARTARAVLVVLRSSGKVAVSVTAPGGGTVSSLPAGTGALGLVVPITQPNPGSYQVSADGQGSVYAAELLRFDGVPAPAPRSSSVKPALARSGSRPGSDLTWALAAGLAALVVAAAVICRLLRSRRRPKGTLLVWRGEDHRIVDPVDVDGPVDPAELFPATSRPTGWTLRWDRRAPILSDPEGTVFPLAPGETRTARTNPPSTFTWFPDGIDTSLSGEPPGRPARTTAAEPIPTSDRD
jgi:hypothetical protein